MPPVALPARPIPAPAPAPSASPGRRRGRPARLASTDAATAAAPADTRERLIRTGVVMLTERGYSAVGVDEVLRSAGATKGSFYHCFGSKERFGQQLIQAYASYFAAKLDRWLLEPGIAPLQRLARFMADAQAGMARHGFQRGCLVGNLGQEMGALPPAFRAQLVAVFADWQQRTAACLRQAQQAGEIDPVADCDRLAEFFWIGWEGAVLRAKLEQSPQPLRVYARGYLQMLGAAA